MKAKQFAALPFRLDKGKAKILLITTRKKGRWTIPKGWPIKGRKPRAAAAIEAFEEAGVVGKIGRRCVGRFKHCKNIESRKVECAVEIFPLAVQRKLRRWPEKRERKRRWFTGKKAIRLVRTKGLRHAIRSFAEENSR